MLIRVYFYTPPRWARIGSRPTSPASRISQILYKTSLSLDAFVCLYTTFMFKSIVSLIEFAPTQENWSDKLFMILIYYASLGSTMHSSLATHGPSTAASTAASSELPKGADLLPVLKVEPSAERLDNEYLVQS